MDTPTLVSIFFALCGTGILLSLAAPPARQGNVLTWLGCLASVALVLAGASSLLAGKTFSQPLWTLPGLGATLTVKLDSLSAVFVLITGLVLFPASIFGGGSNVPSRAFTVFMFGLYASIVLIFLAGDVVLFLLAWEVMSILCWLLIVCGEDGRWKMEDGTENRGTPSSMLHSPSSSGYLLLAMGEAGTLAAALGFLLLAVAAGSLDFSAIKSAASGLDASRQGTVFLLSFFGFGVKAGLVPVNFWLPRAYVAAPRAFVPVLAGATLNLGLYGILRVNADLMPATHAAPGLVALVVGTLSALVGILYATTDNDLKIMLAHSSIENVGIIVAGFGAGMVFVATNHPALAAIASVAALYHLINHSLYKTLLFFGVSEIEKQTGTRDMDRLGSLSKWMPLTALGFLVGTLSIAALPPFNGFVSEWLTLQTMLRSAELSSTGVKMVFALCGAGLALTAALAVTCFVKVYAMSFLGMRRLEEERKVSETKSGTLAPMAILAALCLAFGVLPTYVIPALDKAANPLVGASAADHLVPPFFVSSPAHDTLPPAFVEDFHNLGAQVGQSVLPGRGLVVLHRGGEANPVVFAMSTSYSFIALIGLLLVTYIVLRLWLTRDRKLTRRLRWDGGVRNLLPEMTYTATGFSNPVRVIFDAVFRPTTVEDARETVAEHFRTAIIREKERVHLVDKLVFHPVRMAVMWFAGRLARMHHGRFNSYAAYALLTLLIVLVVFLLLETS
ncbi:MAG TPA: proton-conducting transporter membrane subunit [Candidatus Sulfopaludibacter sp.]|nr:proton-conducting transporter membrane subunit [Candidatus Sulfopaludibacter sp.]